MSDSSNILPELIEATREGGEFYAEAAVSVKDSELSKLFKRMAQAKADLKASIERRLAAATDQIASAEAAAIRQVREQAVSVAVAAAGDVLAKQMTAEEAAGSIDAAIAQVDAKLH